ncbi:MAG: discoidin domain-containing protein [Rikenellaceae bacterium]
MGSTIQNADFSNAKTLFVFDSLPEIRWQEIDISSNQSYRYFRYIGEDNSFANIAEIELYDQNNSIIKICSPIGTARVSEELNENNRAFDGDELTYFNSMNSDNCWVGADLIEPRQISKIRYLQRNDDNYIRKGLEYALYYWDNDWIHIETQIGKEDGESLIFKKCPKNALFLLRCLTKGREERIFTYENNEQIWW